MVELFYEKLGKKVTQRCLENSHVSHLKDSTDFLENKAGNIELINENGDAQAFVLKLNLGGRRSGLVSKARQ